ncbi:MAG TPA: NUDIX domain-containing protein [Bacteroidales bacterium]|nr:NUDIX domain-containing protein [Bacteroidales bacterium]HNR42346.1 NUDIX domain-containing protein [Bacteroidales bacterium]HPM18887.1 NUDIX domain-containing protein [Bacteroidales bacterium]HQG77915.1 NUDIX domain-containing protein [Bacteroidales bacterium]
MNRVSCAVIRNEENEILILQGEKDAGDPLRWEFPYGSPAEDETDEECIIRVTREQLGIDIVICSLMEIVEYDCGYGQISLTPFICDTLDELPFLTVHTAFRWITPDELRNIEFTGFNVQVAHDYFSDHIGQGNRCEETLAGEFSNLDSDDAIRLMVGSFKGAREAELLAGSAIANGEVLKKLLDYSFSDDRKLAFRASWTLSKLHDKIPEIVTPYLGRLIGALDTIDNESVQRSFLRIVSLSDLNLVPARDQGMLADHCFRMLKSGFSAIAVKAYSIEIIYKLALIYPELSGELAATVRLLEDEAPTGVLAKGRNLLRKLAAKQGEADPSGMNIYD